MMWLCASVGLISYDLWGLPFKQHSFLKPHKHLGMEQQLKTDQQWTQMEFKIYHVS